MKGIVDFYKTYPGMYIPSPLRVESFDSDSSLEDLCKEILGLTKMYWNNTQLDGRLPITLECANKGRGHHEIHREATGQLQLLHAAFTAPLVQLSGLALRSRAVLSQRRCQTLVS
jgi:hypothetical protein